MVYNFECCDANKAHTYFAPELSYSVGGADYGSVRIGAFMGKEMIKSSALETFSHSQTSNDVTNSFDLDANGSELIGAEANLGYLCNLSPHRYVFLAFLSRVSVIYKFLKTVVCSLI